MGTTSSTTKVTTSRPSNRKNTTSTTSTALIHNPKAQPPSTTVDTTPRQDQLEIPRKTRPPPPRPRKDMLDSSVATRTRSSFSSSNMGSSPAVKKNQPPARVRQEARSSILSTGTKRTSSIKETGAEESTSPPAKKDSAGQQQPSSESRFGYIFKPPLNDLITRLNSEKLGGCHGVLHAAGLRRFSDLSYITKQELEAIGLKEADVRQLTKVIDRFNKEKAGRSSPRNPNTAASPKLPPVGDPLPVNHSNMHSAPGAFEVPFRRVDFDLCSDICPRDEIFTGRFFNVEQCQQLIRMSEAYAYANKGWRPEIYTLTNLDLHVKAIPHMLDLVHPFMKQLMDDMHLYYPKIKPGTTRYRNDNEPHLVKYTGEDHKGVCMHTDSADVTVNIALSDPADFSDGGTYFESIDETVKPEQGEMVLHVGSLKHSGVDITSGIRYILVSFFSCEWEPGGKGAIH